MLVLLLGLGGAYAVYRIGTREADLTDDALLTGFARAESRQMGIMYGKIGLLMADLMAGLRRPGAQAAIIAAVSILIAGGCFYIAHLVNHHDDTR